MTFWQAYNYADAANSGVHAHLKPIGLELDLFIYKDTYLKAVNLVILLVKSVKKMVKIKWPYNWLLDVIMHLSDVKSNKINMRLKSF